MKNRSRYEMSELVTREQSMDDFDGAVLNPFHRGGDIETDLKEGDVSGQIGDVSDGVPRIRTTALAKPMITSSPLESMDFEEVESRQWRKVYYLLCIVTVLMGDKFYKTFCAASFSEIISKQRQAIIRVPHDHRLEMGFACSSGHLCWLHGWSR